MIVAVAVGVAWWLVRPETLEVETAIAKAEATGGDNDAGAQKTLLNATGYVTARREATVSSKITGKVMETLVEEGLRVEQGQVLARLDATNAEASLRLAEAQLESSRKSVEETKPNLLFAQQELQRYEGLVRSHAASQSDTSRAQAEERARRCKAHRQQADVVVSERTVATWKQALDDTVILAPFPGIVTSKNAQPGEMISPMSAGGFTRTGICTLVDMTSIEIEVYVNESYINRVEPGQPVMATLDSYPDWQIPCHVIAIIPTADRQKATVKVRIGFEKLDSRILPDMGVKVAFHQSAVAAKSAPIANGGFFVPKSAVQLVSGADVVWVILDGNVVRRAVTVTQTVGDESTISSGLTNAEKVIINAPSSLKDGSHVEGKEIMSTEGKTLVSIKNVTKKFPPRLGGSSRPFRPEPGGEAGGISRADGSFRLWEIHVAQSYWRPGPRQQGLGFHRRRSPRPHPLRCHAARQTRHNHRLWRWAQLAASALW